LIIISIIYERIIKVGRKILPEGFEELFEYLRIVSNIKDNIEAKEIQNALTKYGFTSGKITGIIHRAENQGYLNRVRRGVYSFDINIFDEECGKDKVMPLVCREIKCTVDNIKKIMGDNISNMSSEEFGEIKEKLDILEKISM